MAGIIDTIKLAGTLVLALPAAMAGLEFLLIRGNVTVGVALIALAVGLVVSQHWLTLPTDIPGLVAKRIVGSITKEPESDPDEKP